MVSVCSIHPNLQLFVDENIGGQKCTTHGNDWSELDPVDMGWCFSTKVKLAHTIFVKKKERKVFFRKTDQGKCDCKLPYQGDEDFILRIGGSTEKKAPNRCVSLFSYGLLTDFTLDFLENGQTITGFHKTYVAKCKKKYGMEEEDIVTLDSWKEAVRRFWLDILKLDMKKSFSCETCGDLPPTLVFDGIALGVQVEKLKLLQEKVQLVLGRKSQATLSATTFKSRTFIKTKSNRTILKETAGKNEWPRKTKGNLTAHDPGMDKFWQMLDTQDVSSPLPTGLKVLMSSLSTSTSTSNLFQVFFHQNYVFHLYLTLAH